MSVRQTVASGVAVVAIVAISAAGAASEARAADLEAGPRSLYDGFYLGITGGYATGKSDIAGKLRRDDADPFSQLVSEDGNADLSGGMIGGLVGYDYALGNGFVIGALGDFSWTGVDGTADVKPDVIGLSGSDYSVDARVNWLGTVRGRVGFEAGNALIYATGGLAFGNVETELRLAGAGNISSDEATQFGWTVGAGLNYLISDHIMLGAEYLYVDLGDKTYKFGGPGEASADTHLNLFRATLGYKF